MEKAEHIPFGLESDEPASVWRAGVQKPDCLSFNGIMAVFINKAAAENARTQLLAKDYVLSHPSPYNQPLAEVLLFARQEKCKRVEVLDEQLKIVEVFILSDIK